ncbi:MAG: hypothetical protein RR494_11330 [Vagococcus sp.]|uniref:hypothetical protein n=1 Tax=Vagococcus TaxID=2737 RepID=UPI002FC86A38
METLYKGKSAHVWEISKKEKQPKWIEDLFNKNSLVWYDDKLKILVPTVCPDTVRDIKRGLLDTLVCNFGGGYQMGNIGDFFDATNGRVISKEKFTSQYTVIDSINQDEGHYV